MKKNYSLLLFFLVLCSCNDHYESEIFHEDMVLQDNSHKISVEDALAKAAHFMDLITKEETRSFDRKVDKIEVFGKKNIITRSVLDESNLDTLLYVVNYANNMGYALISGDLRLGNELYAISNKGNFDLSDTVNVPEMNLIVRLLEKTITNDIISTTRSSGYLTSPDNRTWQIQQRIDRPVYCEWDQGSPFNKYCFTTYGSQAVAGCVPIAISQIMYYHKHPSSYHNCQFNWGGMESVTNTTTASSYPYYADQVARLIREVGGLVYAVYGVNATGASTQAYAVDCFEAMKYKVSTIDGVKGMYNYDISRIKDGLAGYGPILIRGDDFYSGHAWVIDSYIKLEDVTPSTSTMGVKEFVNCKWGWSYGICDGYYFSGLFDLTQGPYLEGNGASSYIFNNGLKILPYIKTLAPNIIHIIPGRNEVYHFTYNISADYPVASDIQVSFVANTNVGSDSIFPKVHATLRKGERTTECRFGDPTGIGIVESTSEDITLSTYSDDTYVYSAQSW